MLTYEQILELIDKLVETPLSEISVSQGEFAISLKKESSNPSESNISTSLVGGNYITPSHIPLTQGPVQVVNQPQAIINAPEPISNLIDICSPMVGTFYSASSPSSPVFVEIGQQIKNGDILCIIEAMKMMNEFPSELSGIIAEICAENAQTVEYGQVLFKIKPN